ncbi:phosphotransferase [Neisseria yangbaofengii]|uniref:phosphotransferase n=1 Tax=Neisseria yangbaofengii TaxID=2709396 RepID=UPI0013E9FB4D|nr:phosphotransferase [Neisseria yangbaofengii]
MLIEADKRIVSRDTCLPGLAALLDTELLLEKLKTLEPFQHAVKVEIQYLRYKPGNSCASTLYIELGDGLGLRYYAKALTPKRFQESWNKPSRQKLVKKGGDHAPLALPELCIMLLHPIHDRSIGKMDWLVSGNALRRMLKACSLPAFETGRPKVDILRYKPERRLVAKVSYGDVPVAILRSSTPDEFSKMLIGSAFGVSHGGVVLAGADGTSCTLATRWQKGDSLCPEEGRAPDDRLVAELGKKLARIHSAGYQHPTRYTLADEIRSVGGVANTFRHILPEYIDWFETLQNRITCDLTHLPEQATLIHGDFSLDQVIRRISKNGEIKLHILDWDRSAQGHPLLDLASFIARLELQLIEGLITRHEADRLSDGLLQSYRRKREADEAGLRLFTASALLRLAAEPFRKRSPYWDQYTLQILQRTHALLDAEDIVSAPAPALNTDSVQEPIIADLLDTANMQPLLQQAGIIGATEHLASACLRHHKPGRRALVEYALPKQNGNRRFIGKYRAKGLDKHSPRIQQALWQKGFDRPSETGVPEVLGVLPELNTWFQSRIDGQTIGSLLYPENRRLAFLGKAAANALIALHQSGVGDDLDLPCWQPADEWTVLDKALTEAQTKLPHLAERIAKVAAQCKTLIGSLPERPSEILHRDFYQDQILEPYGTPGRMVLLDLDLACRGDGALDAGNYLAHIKEFALRRYGKTDALCAHERAFGQQFLTHNPQAANTVEAYTTLALARHIRISTLFDERSHTTEPLLLLCESRLNNLKQP